MTMNYISTRGEAPALGFSDAVLTGLARDGGLYIPSEWPQFSAAEIRAMRGLAYPDLAIRLLTPFLGGEIAAPAFERIVREAYATFRHEAVCPIVQLGPDSFVLELFHGPTLAFKDVAMQMLARLMDHILAERGQIEVGDFCGKQYRFDAVDAAQLFTAPGGQVPGSSVVQ